MKEISVPEPQKENNGTERFRIWGDKGCWISGISKMFYFEESEEKPFECLSIIRKMPCINRKDIYGRWIYVDDIVEINIDGKDYYATVYDDYLVVETGMEFSGYGNDMLKITNIQTNVKVFNFDECEMKVVGNIHENRELITYAR